MSENDPFMKYTDNLVLRRNAVLEQLLKLDEVREGNEEAWQWLLETDDELREALADSTSLTRFSLDRQRTS